MRSNIKDKITFFYYWEEKLWDKKVDANKYFATISILMAAIFGALTGGGNALKGFFGTDTEISTTASIGMCILLWGVNMAESIVASTDAWTAFKRSLLMMGCIAGAYIAGFLLAVVVIIIVAIVIAIFIGITILGVIFGNSSSKGEEYLVDEEGNKIKVRDYLFGEKVDKNGKRYARHLDGKFYKQ